MEKNFTLMKTLTAAFLDLLFPRRKNSHRVNNGHVSTTGGCGTKTTVNNEFIYVNDPDRSGSFLLFEQAVIIDQPSTMDAPQSTNDDQKLKSKEESKRINDELALGSSPKPVYKTWKERVNDDLAACTAVDDPLFPPVKNSYKRKNDNINVDHIFTISDTTTINNYTTRTTNDPDKSGSFSFFIKDLLFPAFFHKQQRLILIPARL
jgi:hypothetical protein